MAIGTSAEDFESAVAEYLRYGAGVFDDLFGVLLEFGLEGLLEGDRFGGDGVHKGSALEAWEDGGVVLLEEVFAHHRDGSARSAQGLVGGGGDYVGVSDGRRELFTGDESGDVGDVGQECRADLIGDLSEPFEVYVAGVGGVAGDYHFGFEFECRLLYGVVVQLFGFTIEKVVLDLIVAA